MPILCVHGQHFVQIKDLNVTCPLIIKVMRSTGLCKGLHYKHGMLIRIAMFGGLHIVVLAALNTTENLLESSWWTG